MTKLVSSLSTSGTCLGIFTLTTVGIRLTVRSLTFSLSTSNALNYPLFYSTNGILSLNTITVIPDDLSKNASLAAPIVKVNEDSSSRGSVDVAIYGCVFKQISYSSGNGASVHATLGGSDKLSITNTEFSNNSALLGGAIYLDLTSTPSTLTLSSLIFANGNSSTIGKTLYVHSSDIAYIVDSSYTEFLSCDSTTAAEGCCQVNSDAALPLSNLTGYSSTHCISNGIIFTSPAGRDTEGCGSLIAPCLTIHRAASACSDTTNIILSSSTLPHPAESVPVTFTSPLTISPSSGSPESITKIVSFISDSQSLFHIFLAGLIAFQRVSFEYTTIDVLSTPLFTLINGGLTLSSVSIYPQLPSTSSRSLLIFIYRDCIAHQ